MNVNIQTPMFQYSVYLSKEAISCLEYFIDNKGNILVFADSYDIGPTGSLNFYRISVSDDKKIKIPIYSVPSQCWISVLLVTEDQRQVLFEEDPSFDYEFDDLDFIRNRNVRNPLFNDKEDEDDSFNPNNQSKNYINPEDGINNQNSNLNNGYGSNAPIINIQNILPETMGQQTIIQPSTLENSAPTNRISITDEQMNGLLSSIDRLTNLFVQQQSNFNLALELQGQQLLQLQPLVAKLAASNLNPVSTSTNDLTTSHITNDEKNLLKKSLTPSGTGSNNNQSLKELLKNIPKTVPPLMPTLYSGNSLNLQSEISNLSVEKKGIDTSKFDKAHNINISHSVSSPSEQLSEVSSVESEDNVEHLDEINNPEPRVLDLDKEKATNIDEILISLENDKNTQINEDLNNKYEEETNHPEQDDIHSIENNIKIDSNIDNSDSILEENNIEKAPEQNNIFNEDEDELSEEDLAILNEINQAIPIDDITDKDIKQLVSAIDVIQSDENDFEDELKEIVNETNELLNSKDVLHFKESVDSFNPSGALKNEEKIEEDMLSQLSAQAEDILSKRDDYLDKEIEESSNSSESRYEHDHKNKQDISNSQNNEDNDDISGLLSIMEHSSKEIEFEPIPEDDEDEDEDKGSGSNEGNGGTTTQSENHSKIENDELDIYALLEKEDKKESNNANLTMDDLSLLDEAIANKKSNSQNSFTAQPAKSEDDFSLESLDDLEALIEPPSKKNKGKAKFTVDDSDNQDEFVSSQILSYVFSDLDEDTSFEVDDFLTYFETNNLHKAFGKINNDKVVYLVCKLLKNKNASPSKFVRPAIQKKLKAIMPDVAKEHWTGSISNIMDVFEEEKLLDGVNEIDICVWFVKNNFF